MTNALFLSQHDSRPMYLQIMEQIKQKVRAGDWPAGHALPSIRELSVVTQVSVITVKRAYAELEAEGVIVTQAGRGSFVASAASLSQELMQSEIDKTVQAFIADMRRMGIADPEMIDQLERALSDENK